MVRAAIALGLLTLVSVEGLSAFSAFRAIPLALLWSFALVLAWCTALSTEHEPRIPPSLTGRTARASAPAPTAFRVALVACAVAVCLALVTALVAPPNNSDSMAYHMPRVAHWLENASVRHYRTFHPAQLIVPPFGDFSIAVIQALAATDRLANMVQWLAYVGSGVVASLIVARIGGNRDAQAFASLVVLTIPMAALQASTTQADLFTAFWFLVFVAIVVDRPSLTNALWAGATLGIGMLTKPTFALVGFPFGVLWALRWVRPGAGKASAARRGFLGSAAVIAVIGIALLLVTPHSIRVARTFATGPWGAGREAVRTRNAAPGLPSLASNVLRDTVLHLPIPGYGRAVVRLHEALGLDPNDPRTTHLFDLTFTDVANTWNRPLTPNEDAAGNPVHLLVALGFVVLALFRRPRDKMAAWAAVIGVAAIAGWLLMQIPFKWQPWTARFDLPFFAVVAVPTGIAMARVSPRVATILVGLFALGALPALLLAVHRPLLDLAAVAAWPLWVWGLLGLVGAALAVRRNGSASRTRDAIVTAGAVVLVAAAVQVGARVFARSSYSPMSILTADAVDIMFRGKPTLEKPYLAATQRLRASDCRVIGLEMRRDDWEYPVWRLLGSSADCGPRICAVAVDDEIVRLPPAETPEPCAV
ncbi:MAG TPA: glycosyltransferase family 39 protein, partial [Candidatus Binatia bacterium]